jgi:hypothetical protein
MEKGGKQLNTFNKKFCPSSYQRHLQLHITVFLLVLGFTLQVLSGSVAYAAQAKTNRPATYPQVIIAIDTTSPSCVVTKTIINRKTNKQISVTHQHCDPGTSIDTRTVPLSYAKAHRDAYVLPLPANASLSEKLQWANQVEQLMAAKQKELHSLVVHPTSCSDGGLRVVLNTGYMTELNEVMGGTVVYDVAADCSNIFLDISYLSVSIVPLNNPVIWFGFDYFDWHNACRFYHSLYPNQTYSFALNSTRAIGYYGVWDLDLNGNLCVEPPVGGIVRSFNSGAVLN